MSECFLTPDRQDIPCECDDCGETTLSGNLDMIRDIEQRLTPGSIVPAGQCPHCGSLAYYEDEHAPRRSAQSMGYRADLLAHAAFDAFEDEEDSVREEHAELIEKLKAYAEGE